MSAERYPASVFWSNEDEGYIAVAPDLPGCSAFGGTATDALNELIPAIEAWIEAALAAGNPVPAPSDPASDPVASGKLLARLPRSLHATLIRMARIEGTSLNQLVVYLLAGGVERTARGRLQAARSQVVNVVSTEVTQTIPGYSAQGEPVLIAGSVARKFSTLGSGSVVERISA
jgi:predicted RNase H-like HicB family nuclease